MARYDFIAAYLLANRKLGTLYAGVTFDLIARMEAHKLGLGSAFADTYGCDRLVWFARYPDMRPAIQHEKRIKRWKRAWKVELIEAANPDWKDLTGELSVYGW